MAKLITPLAHNVPIVDEEGNPTPYFGRILEEISDARISASVIDAMGGDPGGDRVVVWDDTTNDLAFMTTSEVLDFITGASHGDILYRDSTGWEALNPGTSGQLLQTNGAGSDPTWVDAPSSNSVIAFSFFNDILSGTTLNVNSTSYTQIPANAIWYDIDTMPFAEYRVIWRGQSNAAGQTCSFKMHTGGGTALAAGDDLTFTNGSNQTLDSGWKTITASLSGFQQLNLFMKGSNATVDMSFTTPYYVYLR